MLKGKKIVLGITGSIAAYKACLIIRGLVKRGAEVQVVITPAGKEFITPITLSIDGSRGDSDSLRFIMGNPLPFR